MPRPPPSPATTARSFEALASTRPFVVMDGGMGTSIEDGGVDVRNALWGSVALLDAAGRALNDAIHRDFAEAGAEVLIANTHNASLAACGEYLAHATLRAGDDALDEAVLARPAGARAEALFTFVNGEAIASARRAASARGACVAGAIGGAESAYTTESRLDTRDVRARLEPHVELLASLDVDLLLFEMVSTASEIAAVAELTRALAERRPELPMGVGFPCSAAGATHGGVSMSAVARAFADAPPRLLFVQCTRHDLVARPLRELAAHVDDARRLGVYANDGRQWIEQRWQGDRVTPQRYAADAARWADLGVSVIGGCCGTRPEHVAALRALGSPSGI